jgi:hypothetical protein
VTRAACMILALGTALSLPPPAAAQEGNPAHVSPAVAARLRALPHKLGGILRVDGHYSWPMALYRGKSSLDPVISVVVTDVAKPVPWRSVAELGRASAIQAGLINTLFEGKFGTALHPGAFTYFGDYLTKTGIKQIWLAEYDGIRITVSATIYRTEDRRAVFDAIRRDLLDGAEISEKVSPADAN